MGEEKRVGRWQEWAAKVFLLLAAVGGGYLIFSRMLWPIMPFLLAFLLSCIIRPSAAFLEKKWGVPRRTGAIVLLLLLLLLIGLLVTLGCRR